MNSLVLRGEEGGVQKSHRDPILSPEIDRLRLYHVCEELEDPRSDDPDRTTNGTGRIHTGAD